jgi:hypothetical protein
MNGTRFSASFLQQNSSWEAHSHSTGQEFPTFYGTVNSWPCSQNQSLDLIVNRLSTVPRNSPFPINCLPPVLILSSRLHLCLCSGIFLLGFKAKDVYALFISSMSRSAPEYNRLSKSCCIWRVARTSYRGQMTVCSGYFHAIKYEGLLGVP